VKRKYPGIEVTKGAYSDKAFLVVAEEEMNTYNGPDKPRTRPLKKKKVK
jgi:hypothetical protein